MIEYGAVDCSVWSGYNWSIEKKNEQPGCSFQSSVWGSHEVRSDALNCVVL